MAKDNKVIDLSGFFTSKRQEEGVWFEPKILGETTGIELKVIGSESDEAASVLAEYAKEMQKVEEIQDMATKNAMTKEIVTTCAAKLVKDLRPIDGYTIKLGEEDVEYSYDLVKEIFENAPRFAFQVVDFSRKDTNFMEKKNR